MEHNQQRKWKLILVSNITWLGKMEELTRENAKILQKIVEARQINVKARN